MEKTELKKKQFDLIWSEPSLENEQQLFEVTQRLKEMRWKK